MKMESNIRGVGVNFIVSRKMPNRKRELKNGLELGLWGSKIIKPIPKDIEAKIRNSLRKDPDTYRKAVNLVERQMEIQSGKRIEKSSEEEQNRRKTLKHTMAVSMLGLGLSIPNNSAIIFPMPGAEVNIKKNGKGKISFNLLAIPSGGKGNN